MLRDEFQVTHSRQGHQFRIPSDTHGKTHGHLNSHCCVGTNPHACTKPHTYSEIDTQSQISYTHMHTQSHRHAAPRATHTSHILTHRTCTAVLPSYTQTHEDRSIISAPCNCFVLGSDIYSRRVKRLSLIWKNPYSFIGSCQVVCGLIWKRLFFENFLFICSVSGLSCHTWGLSLRPTDSLVVCWLSCSVAHGTLVS